MGVTQTYASLVVCRFFLGLCEAGFFPGEMMRYTSDLNIAYQN